MICFGLVFAEFVPEALSESWVCAKRAASFAKRGVCSRYPDTHTAASSAHPPGRGLLPSITASPLRSSLRSVRLTGRLNSAAIQCFTSFAWSSCRSDVVVPWPLPVRVFSIKADGIVTGQAVTLIQGVLAARASPVSPWVNHPQHQSDCSSMIGCMTRPVRPRRTTPPGDRGAGHRPPWR